VISLKNVINVILKPSCIAVLVAILLNNVANAAADATKVATPDPANFRCEKLRSQTIADLKAKMLEHCDLDKPFSTSMSLSMGEEAYMYCCTIKK